MTSNLGSDVPQSIGFGKSSPRSFESEVMSFFRPEFFNRLDEVATFAPLAAETIRAIAAKELRQIAGREGFERAGLKLQWSARLEDLMAQRGFDQRYGARPLQRTLELEVVAPVAHWIAHHPDVKNATVNVDVDEENRVCVKQR